MTHIVVTLDPMSDGACACAVQAPYAIADQYLVTPVRLDDAFEITGPHAVRDLGCKLAEKIRANATVGAVLDIVLATASHGESRPIAFRVGDARAHALSWEALVGNDDFLALDERWPIARIARGGVIPHGARRPFAAPLHVAAVLSAVGRPALEEWRGMAAAIQAARDDEFDIVVTVLAGEEEVVEEARSLEGVVALPVPKTATALIAALRDCDADIVHLYCHGSIASTVRRLEIGTVGDFDRDDGHSSVVVRADELGLALAEANTWAVVLNTCRGAEAVEDTITHAEEIVSRGVPVAIGHRRLIDAADAFAFSAALYPQVFDAVHRAASNGATTRVLDWAGMLVAARRVLRDKHGPDADSTESWTVPVIYTRPGEFELVPSDTGTAVSTTRTLGEHETIEGIAELLEASAPAELVADLLELKPDLP